jgi:hypothetical protein
MSISGAGLLTTSLATSSPWDSFLEAAVADMAQLRPATRLVNDLTPNACAAMIMDS